MTSFSRLNATFLTGRLTFFCLMLILTGIGCSKTDPPPYFTARVTDVYKNVSTVENFKLLYWWEERGDTPFLMPYTYPAKELIVEIMVPFKDDPRRVTVKTERIALKDIRQIKLTLGELGKNINVITTAGRRLTATDAFPRILKKGKKTGFADSKVFAIGNRIATDKKEEFKIDLNLLKSIEIINIYTDHKK